MRISNGANQAKKTNIGIFGYGHMGQAIFKLLQKNQIGKQLNFCICSIGLKKIKNAVYLNSLEELINQSDIIFLCVKPQDFYNLKPAELNNKIFISIMAGVKIANVKKIVNSQSVVRVMPNLPLQVGQGVIAWFADEKKFSKNKLSLIKKFFFAFGYNFKVKIEDDLDKITAISGSGPAYVFLFMDALMESAINLGFSPQQAEAIIFELLVGSLKYYQNVKNIYTPGQLINMVKSKKGTTEAAFNKLNPKKFYKQWQDAILEAYKRAQKLSY
ncbi:MAG: pyrroline-5-carboxylate reductase [Patescibacteria group bacterium]|nr:pyrroline-5-carboxylate reductase [Patescibacteria group bacterium]